MSVKGHISKELLERAKFVSLRKLKEQIELIEYKEIPPPEARGSSS